jgi:hypothetical protein
MLTFPYSFPVGFAFLLSSNNTVAVEHDCSIDIMHQIKTTIADPIIIIKG